MRINNIIIIAVLFSIGSALMAEEYYRLGTNGTVLGAIGAIIAVLGLASPFIGKLIYSIIKKKNG